MKRILTRLSDVPILDIDTTSLASIESLYRFRAPANYLKLIDPNDPNDPIRRLIIPDISELQSLESLDPTSESRYTAAPGLQHKFTDTALLLVTANCAGYCRYCFRKRLFQPANEEVPRSLDEALNYIRKHPEINNVILSGGDAFSLSTNKLVSLLEALSNIDSVRIIRIASKTPAFDPGRIVEDFLLLSALERISRAGKQLYLMAHFDHPREVTSEARNAVRSLAHAGLTCLNQCPLIQGINSDVGVLSELFEQMAYIGCPQYYVFHCRPTDGNSRFVLPLKEAFEIFERETQLGSGLSRTARYCIAHVRGKIQVLNVEGDRVLLRYLQAYDESLSSKTFWHSLSQSVYTI